MFVTGMDQVSLLRNAGLATKWHEPPRDALCVLGGGGGAEVGGGVKGGQKWGESFLPGSFQGLGDGDNSHHLSFMPVLSWILHLNRSGRHVTYIEYRS